MAWPGVAGRGRARRGEAGHGMAGRGKAFMMPGAEQAMANYVAVVSLLVELTKYAAVVGVGLWVYDWVRATKLQPKASEKQLGKE